MSIRSRVVDAVEAWHAGPEKAVPTSKLLAGLWVRNRELEYNNVAKRALISELKSEFSNTTLGLPVGSFANLTRVQDVVVFVETR